MRKYLHVFTTGLQNTLTYRINFLFRAVFGLVPLAGNLFVWRAIYDANPHSPSVAGYTAGTMISYYLVMTIVDALTAVAEDDWQIAADIREGTISQFLLKPVDYLAYRLSLYAAGRIIYTSCALLPVLLFTALLWHDLAPPPPTPALAAFILSTAMAALIQFFIAYAMALLAFWILDVSTFIFIQFAFEYIASGHLFPLDILPPWLNQLVHLTPYPYLLFFPVSIYLGRTQGPELIAGLVIQAAWVAAGYFLARFVWNRGIRHYSAYGG